ncbi:hypothetical protein GUITHDRAFT_156158 [Guillardia theta CCMP2712]|uniref:Myb-like domain-containing protein n=1 Tax=Guillardia theta (strain CCMP2712) TaxID=905079 RepID=L1IB04_GUITC|nr:hypothetical protein GUITHDRAFT_156158 [Guillardia theta CCMP2712]EKX33099.1 hypothetical protein GUITHDRAFT_156158 [Guillardia theta CCMP2712]|eukprot:XP_005820079.1 hypothetical protein GUITHDRAFT_156158 [Guillardia theta CCMP2712]
MQRYGDIPLDLSSWLVPSPLNPVQSHYSAFPSILPVSFPIAAQSLQVGSLHPIIPSEDTTLLLQQQLRLMESQNAMKQKMLMDALTSLASTNMLLQPAAVTMATPVVAQEIASPPSQDMTPIDAEQGKKGKVMKSKKSKQTMRKRSFWSDEEHQLFMDALKKYNVNPMRETKADGKLYVGLGPYVADMIAIEIGTRNAAQVRSHAQKYFQKTCVSALPAK